MCKTYLCFVIEVGDEVHSSNGHASESVTDANGMNYFKLSRVRMCVCVCVCVCVWPGLERCVV